MNKPTVSIVMPVYNGGRYFSRSIPSVLSQDFTDRELLIIDDGSTDDTNDLVKDFLTDKRISYHLKKHEGLGSTKNYGAKIAQGKYVTFLDVDDEYLSTHIGSRVAYMDEHPDVDMIYGGCVIQGDPYVVDVTDPSKKIHIQDTVQGATAFARIALLHKIAFANVYAESFFFVQEAVKMGAIIESVQYPSYIYHRDNPDSRTNLVSKGIIID